MSKRLPIIILFALTLASCFTVNAETVQGSFPIRYGGKISYKIDLKETATFTKWNFNARLFGLCWRAYKFMFKPLPYELAYTDTRFLQSKVTKVFYYWGESNSNFVVKGNKITRDGEPYGFLIDSSTSIEDVKNATYLEIHRELTRENADMLITQNPELQFINLEIQLAPEIAGELCRRCPVKYVHWGFVYNEISYFLPSSNILSPVSTDVAERMLPWCESFFKSVGSVETFEYISLVSASSWLEKYSVTLGKNLKGIEILSPIFWLTINRFLEKSNDLIAFNYYPKDVLDRLPMVFKRSKKLRYFRGCVHSTTATSPFRNDCQSHRFTSLVSLTSNPTFIRDKIGGSVCDSIRDLRILEIDSDLDNAEKCNLGRFKNLLNLICPGGFSSGLFDGSFPPTLFCVEAYSVVLKKGDDIQWFSNTAREIFCEELLFFDIALEDLPKPNFHRIAFSSFAFSETPMKFGVFKPFLNRLVPKEGVTEVFCPLFDVKKGEIAGLKLISKPGDNPAFGDIENTSNYLQILPYVVEVIRGD